MIERHGEELPHSAIRMDSQYPDVLAAVVTARAAGMAAAAAQIGLDSAGIACREPSVVWRSLNNLHSQFVAKHTRRTRTKASLAPAAGGAASAGISRPGFSSTTCLMKKLLYSKVWPVGLP